MSGPRVVGVHPDTLAPEQRTVYAAIAGGPRAQGPQAFPLTDADGRLRGPFNAMLLSPRIGDALQSLGAAVRYSGGLTARERELAVLAVATRWRSRFERESHEAVGAQAGLTRAEMAAAAQGGALPATADDREAEVLAWTRVLAARWDADDTAYDRAVAALGRTVAYEVSVLVGYYSLLALHLRVFGDEHERDGDA